MSRLWRKPVESSSIATVGYDSDTRVLDIEFKESGEVYRYFDVPLAEYEAFLQASSKGLYLNQQFKKAGYRYERLQ
jgi:hypothetical protein